MNFLQKKNQDLEQLVNNSRSKNFISVLENLYESQSENLNSAQENELDLLNEEQKIFLNKNKVSEEMLRGLLFQLRTKNFKVQEKN